MNQSTTSPKLLKLQRKHDISFILRRQSRGWMQRRLQQLGGLVWCRQPPQLRGALVHRFLRPLQVGTRAPF